MPTPTYTPLANITLSSTASSITFSNINQNYRDVVLVVRGTSTSGQVACSINVNNDVTNNYRYVLAGGNGSQANSYYSSSSDGFYLGQGNAFIDSTTNRWHAIVNFLDYSSTNKQKSVLARENESAKGSDMYVEVWRSTAAITSIKVAVSSLTWAIGSSFALYGIVA